MKRIDGKSDERGLAVYAAPMVRFVCLSIHNPILENSRLDGDNIEDVSEEDNPFFS